MNDIEHAVRERRIALGKTQRQLAQVAGISVATLSAFESGARAITLRNLERLLAVLGLELSARDAAPRPTLDELAARYGDDESKPLRRRVRPRKT